MDFLGYGIPLGRYFGINVRLHFTLLIYAYLRATSFPDLGWGLAFVAGLYLCILLHEFGHALAARWCDGEANDILLWPLGGLAFVRPAFNPTAHLITTVAGPFVTLVLWLAFSALSRVLSGMSHVPWMVQVYVNSLSGLNLWLLLFNLIPAFPMDGGRILRDVIWHWMSAEKATAIAVWVSRVIAVLGALFAIYRQNWWLLVFPLFIMSQCAQEQRVVAFEAGGTYQFSVRERLQRGRRQRTFRGAVRDRTHADATTAFHRCATCGVTELADRTTEFRVCPDCSNGQEYCRAHLETHPHV